MWHQMFDSGNAIDGWPATQDISYSTDNLLGRGHIVSYLVPDTFTQNPNPHTLN